MSMSTFGRLVKIADWAIDAFKKMGQWFKSVWRSFYERQVDSAVDDRNDDAVKRIILRIRAKRKDRRDKS